MAETTGIGWCDATFNPWVGCEKVSPGCAHCYAEVLVTGRMGRANTWGPDGVRQRTSENNWQKPIVWDRHSDDFIAEHGHRRRVFCASLADVFEPRPELEPWRRELFDLITDTPNLDWLLLTKRPEEARDWMRAWYEEDIASPASRDPLFRLEGDENWYWRDGATRSWAMLPNIWIGASVENARFTWRADVLREIPAAVRFLSCEPLVGSLYAWRPTPRVDASVADIEASAVGPAVGTADATADEPRPRSSAPLNLTGIDWVIVGGESGGRNARPMHPAWAREIRDAALAVSVADEPMDASRLRPALFFKQWGSWAPDEFGRDPNGTWVSPDGRKRTSFAADAYDDLPDGSMRMRYAGSSPKAGGKILDGVQWCEFPEAAAVPV